MSEIGWDVLVAQLAKGLKGKSPFPDAVRERVRKLRDTLDAALEEDYLIKSLEREQKK